MVAGSKIKTVDGIKNILSESKALFYLYIIVFLVGIHSAILGIGIYHFPNNFYRLFFSADVDNYFFVKQAGLFLCCLGFIYLFPLLKMKMYHGLIVLIFLTKLLAVIFMVCNAEYSLNPDIIKVAAFGDGLMAVLLIIPYTICRRKGVL